MTEQKIREEKIAQQEYTKAWIEATHIIAGWWITKSDLIGWNVLMITEVVK